MSDERTTWTPGPVYQGTTLSIVVIDGELVAVEEPGRVLGEREECHWCRREAPCECDAATCMCSCGDCLRDFHGEVGGREESVREYPEPDPED